MEKKLVDLTLEELWQLFPIQICEHNVEWKNLYLQESERIASEVGSENFSRISHIGSTYISGLLAKPTIDILLEITDAVQNPALIQCMESMGYLYTSQPNSPPPHLMFMKGYTMEGFKGQVFHVHVRYPGDWDELYFRDYLMTHPEKAQAYGNLKWHLKDLYKHDRDGYTLAKTDFIREATKQARLEFPNKYVVFEK